MEAGGSMHDASIVLTGIRGTGRSTLALLAANHLGFNIIDTDIIFRQVHGMTDRAYALKYGQEECCRQQLILMRSALDSNPIGAVIVCGVTSIVKAGQRLLNDYCASHPVIYIIRDAEEVANYLQHRDVAAITSIMDAVNPTFRSISNFEFYNLPDAAFTSPTESTKAANPAPPSLVMKRSEFDFLELLASASGQPSPRMSLAQTLTSLAPLEARPYTYALVLTISQIEALSGKLRGLDSMADAVELVIDVEELLGEESTLSSTKATWISRMFYILRRNLRLPIIYHVQYAKQHFATFSSPYLDLIRHGVRIGSDFITIDLRLGGDDVQSLLTNKSRSKFIGNFHDDFPGLDAWNTEARKALLRESEKRGFDLIRFTQRATSETDNISIQRFIRYREEVCRAHILLIAYNTGPIGSVSCYQNRILTPVTHPLIRACNLTQNDDDHSGILTVSQTLRALYESSCLEAYFFGVFGPDLNLSMAPFLHNSAFSYCGMPHEYKTFQGPSLGAFESTLRDPNFGGGSITRHFKSEVIPLLDYLSPAATAIGAVNTVIPLRSRETNALLDRGKRGKVVALYGENTDWIAIHTCIRRSLSPINAMKGRGIGLVLGAGGTAHAAVYSMIYLGVKKIYVWNRTMENAENMAQRFSEKTFATSGSQMGNDSEIGASGQNFGPSKVIVVPSKEDPWPGSVAPPNIIVSCIPYPNFQIHDSWLSSRTGGTSIELSYTPLETPLLAQVRKLAHRGWIANDGMTTFPEQAIAQFELFTGRKAPRNLMRSLCYSRYSDNDVKS